ncbi:SDR family oxidoreductase [Mesoterricola silvestris]|uniref:Short-chain dehydrogenase n=1 Tax=Mesoterricola silvestris TaxID=2927979 RepID=A0AA48GYQ8_9BACT|nr:SDR family oxidoreductase [Mesoterricola silvestris]BDU74326.1 short-chain dehydrogenase [Mesoterricola silvestris]
MTRLQGKIALITGGTTGIGLAAARSFHAEGARVFVTGRNPETLAAAREALPKDITVLQADSASLADLDQVVARVKAEAGRIDVLFVNAGIGKFVPIEAVDEAHWDGIMDVNLKGAFFLAQKALPLLPRGASVIFTTSVVDRKGFPNAAVYSTSKAGLAGLVRVLATELAPRGIRVNSLAPGPIATPIHAKLGLPPEAMAGMEERLKEMVPLKRLGLDTEVAKAALFLASDDASYITGEELLVDGGAAIA